MRCTKAVIYRENIINNLMQVKSVLKPHTKICVAVKADGYGTSALETAKIASSLDIDYLAVATVDEPKTPSLRNRTRIHLRTSEGSDRRRG